MANDVRPCKDVLTIEIVDQQGDVVETHEIRDPRPMYIEEVNSDPIYAELGLQARVPDERPQIS